MPESFTKLLEELKERLAEIDDLYRAAAVLDWDQQVFMPGGGNTARSEQSATLISLAHQRFVDPKIGELLNKLSVVPPDTAYDSFAASLIRVCRRQYEREVRVPTSLVMALSRASSDGYNNWLAAREANNFSVFAPALQKLVHLQKERADAIGYDQCRYDALLDEGEPGMTCGQLDAIFSELKTELVPMVHIIARQSDRVDASCLHQLFDEATQIELTLDVLRCIGFDFERGRQDISVHPFTTSFSSDDVRITTRVDAHYLGMGFYGSIHEGGHAIYEQGIDLQLARTPLADGASAGMHESQSRLWENLIGRSLEFWQFYLPRLQKFFPEQTGHLNSEVIYHAVNKSQPSMIRVEADEVTYNLHILLRYELERELIDGNLDVQDLPNAWQQKMREYLGLQPQNDLEGVLQDIHWAGGHFANFPGYTLGNLISAQLYEAVLRAEPSLPTLISQGDFAPLLQWLRENIHQYGAKFTANELVERATGQPLTVEPYLTYLRQKYSALYPLKE